MNAIKTSDRATFHNTGMASDHMSLFRVTSGVPIVDALQSASVLLDMARTPIHSAGMGRPLVENPAWLVLNALESAKAIIDSLVCQLEVAQ
jgi:hypothetical protein